MIRKKTLTFKPNTRPIATGNTERNEKNESNHKKPEFFNDMHFNKKKDFK